MIFSASPFFFQRLVKQLLLMLSASIQITVFTGQACIAEFIKPLGMKCMPDFPSKQREYSKQNKCQCKNVGKEYQKAILKKGIPIINPAFHTAVWANKDRMKRAPAKYGEVYREIRECKQKEYPDSIYAAMHIQPAGNGQKNQPKQHCKGSTPIIHSLQFWQGLLTFL